MKRGEEGRSTGGWGFTGEARFIVKKKNFIGALTENEDAANNAGLGGGVRSH